MKTLIRAQVAELASKIESTLRDYGYGVKVEEDGYCRIKVHEDEHGGTIYISDLGVVSFGRTVSDKIRNLVISIPQLVREAETVVSADERSYLHRLRRLSKRAEEMPGIEPDIVEVLNFFIFLLDSHARTVSDTEMQCAMLAGLADQRSPRRAILWRVASRLAYSEEAFDDLEHGIRE